MLPLPCLSDRFFHSFVTVCDAVLGLVCLPLLLRGLVLSLHVFHKFADLLHFVAHIEVVLLVKLQHFQLGFLKFLLVFHISLDRLLELFLLQLSLLRPFFLQSHVLVGQLVLVSLVLVRCSCPLHPLFQVEDVELFAVYLHINRVYNACGKQLQRHFLELSLLLGF